MERFALIRCAMAPPIRALFWLVFKRKELKYKTRGERSQDLSRQDHGPRIIDQWINAYPYRPDKAHTRRRSKLTGRDNGKYMEPHQPTSVSKGRGLYRKEAALRSYRINVVERSALLLPYVPLGIVVRLTQDSNLIATNHEGIHEAPARISRP